MDEPYICVRRDKIGPGVTRARTRYLGDAMIFVDAVIKNELNHCEWRVVNEDTGRLCARWTYKAGKIWRHV